MIAIISLVVCLGVAKVIQVRRSIQIVTATVESLNGAVGSQMTLLGGPRELVFSLGGLDPLVTDKHLSELTPHLRSLQGIESISLAGTRVTDSGVVALLDIFGKTLKRLDISGVNIGRPTTAALSTLDRLSCLSLSNSALSENSIGDLSMMSHLAELHIFNSKGSASMLSLLQQRLPNVTVYFHEEPHSQAPRAFSDDKLDEVQ